MATENELLRDKERILLIKAAYKRVLARKKAEQMRRRLDFEQQRDIKRMIEGDDETL